MVDNTNPTSQFHPYVPQTATPQTGKPMNTTTGLGNILGKLGIDQSKIGALGSGSLKNVRTIAQNNSGLVLGGLAALAIGAGLMRKRSMSMSKP
ncbi:MAG: LPXTG cell wall anchor domain-containing protein [Acidobacteriota bacterium]|nr:LPXTG cell wall anchor domain-containing protein [Acidobacteriota bacterium]